MLQLWLLRVDILDELGCFTTNSSRASLIRAGAGVTSASAVGYRAATPSAHELPTAWTIVIPSTPLELPLALQPSAATLPPTSPLPIHS
jgi:hypothetical protein